MIIDAHTHLFSYEDRVASFSDALPALLKEMSLNQIPMPFKKLETLLRITNPVYARKSSHYGTEEETS